MNSIQCSRKFHCFVFVSKEALAAKDQVIKEVNTLTQKNQILQQSVDAVQKDKAEVNAEKSKVGNMCNQCHFCPLI